jgi:hypothetical protein
MHYEAADPPAACKDEAKPQYEIDYEVIGA